MKSNTIINKQQNETINAFTTKTAIRKWGNSQGIRLSKKEIKKQTQIFTPISYYFCV